MGPLTPTYLPTSSVAVARLGSLAGRVTADTTMMMVQHVGMGVARRAAEHERRRAEREADEAEIDLPDEDERVAVK